MPPPPLPTQAGRLLHGGANNARAVYTRLPGHQEWVARDLFLDGNPCRKNSSAKRLLCVAEAEVGLSYRWTGWVLDYQFIVRSREYEAQPVAHRYESPILSRSNEPDVAEYRSEVEVRWQCLATDPRISSAVLVQMNLNPRRRLRRSL